LTDPVTITIEGDLFRAAKQAFEDRCELELSDREFIDHAMRFICTHIRQESQLRALRLLGKTPVLTTHEEISAIAEQIQRLQFANRQPYNE